MPFKIIETIERGRRLISTVPSLWEKDGQLYWPRKNVNSLKKNEESTPQPDWKCLHCILLRNNILDYKTAEIEMALMSDATDTDDKENKYTRKNTSVGPDLNYLVTECIQQRTLDEQALSVVTAKEASPVIVAENSSSIVATEDASSVIVVESNALMPLNVNNISIQEVSQENGNNPTETPVIPDNSFGLQLDDNLLLPDSDQHIDHQIEDPQISITESIQVPQQIGYLIEIMSAVQDNQKVLFENQQNILKGLALINTKIEEFFARSQGPFQNQQRKDSSSFKIIQNIEELKTLEEQLEDPLMETKYLEELSIVCSENKTGHNNAYALVDTMFDRKLMTRCSWGGGTKGEPKHCFKAFSKTINLFLKIVHQYDKTFTKPICEDFLKNVLRHSAKRNKAKRVRNSTSKKKIKKSKVENGLQENKAGPSNESNLINK